MGDMSQISEILTEKGRRVLKIDADASVLEAVELMVEENVGSLVVTDSGDVTGIVTERDYLRRVALEGRTDAETSVREIMSSPLIVVTPETAIAECMALMTNKRIRHLPVVDAGEVAGSSRSGTSSSSSRDSRATRSSSYTTTSRRVKRRLLLA